MRVLHVIDAGPCSLREFARPQTGGTFDDRVAACRTLVERTDDEHVVCLVGARRAAARAADLGLRLRAVVPSILGRPHLSPGPMGSLLRSIRPDMVHWWNSSWTGGCFGRPGRAWHVESIAGFTPLRLPLWLSGGGAIACSPEERARAIAAGLTPHPAEPPVEVSPRHVGRRAGPARILLLGPGGDARQFIFLCGLIQKLGLEVEALIPSSAPSLARARRFHAAIRSLLRMVISNRPRRELLARADLAVWIGPGEPRPMAARSALAAHVPVVIPPSGAWAIPEPLHDRLVALNSTHGELARKIWGVVEHPLAPIHWAGLVDADRWNDRFARDVSGAYEGRAGCNEAAPAIIRARVESPAA